METTYQKGKPKTESLPVLTAITTGWTGILAGTVVVEMLVHQPALYRLGAEAYFHYLEATAFTRGVVLYPVLGLSGIVLAWTTFIVALRMGAASRVKVLLGIAAVSTLLGVMMAGMGVPIIRLIQANPGTERLMALLERFALFSRIRAIFIILTFLCSLLSLFGIASRNRPLRPKKEVLPLIITITILVASILGGASIPMMIVDRPAWHSIGAVAYTAYSRVTDGGPARFIYPPLAFCGVILTWTAVAIARKAEAGSRIRVSLAIAAAASVLVLLMTIGAAPNLLRAHSSPDDEAVLAPLLDRFVAWSIPRAVFLVATFWAMVSALELYAVRRWSVSN